MKKENVDLVKQAIVNEYGVSGGLATIAAEAALEGVGKSLIALADKLVKPEGDGNEAD